MKCRLSLGSQLLIVLLAAGASSACVAEKCETESGEGWCLESPERYNGDTFSDVVDYTPGMSLEVDGIYGNINVMEGAPREVAVRFRPFAYSGQNEDEEADRAMEDKAGFALTVDGDTIVVETGRTDGKLPLVGVDIEIELPPEFDGEVRATNRGNGTWNPGDIDIDFVGFASRVEMRSDELSRCGLVGGPEVFYTYARCGDDVFVRGVSDTLDLVSTGGFGKVSVELDSVSPLAANSRVHSEDGDVEVKFPAGSSFLLQAQSDAPDVVHLGSLASECTIAEASASAKSARCGDDDPLPLYHLTSNGGSVLVDFL